MPVIQVLPVAKGVDVAIMGGNGGRGVNYFGLAFGLPSGLLFGVDLGEEKEKEKKEKRKDK